MVKRYSYRKIALLGGSFNPPHKGHIMMAKLALKKHKPHQIWLMLAKQNRLKNIAPPAMNTRYQWCKKLHASTIIQPKKIEQHIPYDDSYSIIMSLKRLYPRHKFLLLMGEDNFLTIQQWASYRLLPSLLPISVIARQPHNRIRRAQQHQLKKDKNWRAIALKHAAKWPMKRGYYVHRNRPYNISSTMLRHHHKGAV